MPPRTRPALTGLLLALLCVACEPREASNSPEPSADEQQGAESSGELTDLLDEASHCRTGRIALPEGSGYLRAIQDDRNGYSVLLPDLADWEMACGEDPFLVASAMRGAVNATVTRFESPESLDVTQYLELFGDQLDTDLAAEGMTLSDKKVGRTEFDHWVLTFKVATKVEDGEIWQFNYITARALSPTRILTLHMAVTARHDDGETDAEIREFADGLVTYMDLFRIEAQ